jgi:hypothetical protein
MRTADLRETLHDPRTRLARETDAALHERSDMLAASVSHTRCAYRVWARRGQNVRGAPKLMQSVQLNLA